MLLLLTVILLLYTFYTMISILLYIIYFFYTSIYFLYYVTVTMLCYYVIMLQTTVNMLCYCCSSFYSFIHSFIHSSHFYSAPSNPLLLRGAPDYSMDTVSEFHAETHGQLQVKDLPKVFCARFTLYPCEFLDCISV